MNDFRPTLILAAVCCVFMLVQETSPFPVNGAIPESDVKKEVQTQPEEFRDKFIKPITTMLGTETTNKILNDTTFIVKEAAGKIVTRVGSDVAGEVAGKKLVQVATALLT